MDDSPSIDASTRKAALIVATATSFTTPFMASSVNIALPAIQREFQINAVFLSWIAATYTLASVVCLVPFGRMADIYGRKKTFTCGVVTFTVASLLAAVSFSAYMLIIFRIFQGIGASMVFATGIAILSSVFPPGERGKALGINVAAVYIGNSAGPFLGGMLTHYLTWRSLFLIVVPLGLTIISLILWKLDGEWAEAKGEKFDLTGSLIYGLSIIAVMYGITLLPVATSVWLILLGVGGAFAFIKWETRTDHPVLEINLFRTNRVFALSGLAALINYCATFAVTFLLSLYLQYIKGLPPQTAGLILICQPLVQAVFSPFAGRLSDRVEPRIVASSGMAMTAIGLFLLTFISKDTSLTFIIASLVFLGFGFAFFSSPNTNAIMSSVEKRFYGIAAGSVGTMRQLGQMLSMGIATLLFSLYIGRVQITAEHYPFFIKSVRVAFSIYSVLCLGGIFASLARGKIRSRVAQPASSNGDSPPVYKERF